MTPTSEQTEILSQARDSSTNLMINALAGTGKTSTLEMIERVVKTKPILYMCFNKRNADEATERMLSTTTVRTFNGMGHRVWGQGRARLSLDPNKTRTILRDIIASAPKAEQSILWEVFYDVIDGVRRAKILGYVPSDEKRSLINQSAFHNSLEVRPDDLTADLIDAVLTRGIKLARRGLIDYDDQIYMPTLFGGAFPTFPLVKVDEFQDLSPINHAMLSKLVTKRLIGVGDPHQNIYAFRGAKQAGMREAQAKWNMTPLDLSVSFRCPSAIVDHVRWHVPKFSAANSGGEVHVLDRLDHSDILPDATIICRNNAPLFALAFALIGVGRSVSIIGSDLGPKIVGIMRRLGDESLSRNGLISAIDDWLDDKLAKESTSAQDLADCMKVFANHGSSLAQAIAFAEHLFAQKGQIKLMTGHKSKGLEFDTVYHLDPFLLDNNEQDKNLRYVISTRSKNRLFEINSTDIRWAT